jgi:hypothetical protein
MSDEIFQSMFQQRADCPALLDLESNLSLAGNHPHRIAAIQHLEECPRCRAQMALLQDFRSAAPRGIEQGVVQHIVRKMKRTHGQGSVPPAARRSLPTRVFVGIAAAAAVLLVGVTLSEQSFRGRRTETPRGTSVYRSSELHAVAPTGDLSSAPSEFRWTAVSNADSYLLQVMEVDRAVVYQNRLRSTAIPTPPEIAALMKPGKTLLWKVTALDAAGRAIQVSTAERFRMTARDK